MSPSKSCIQYFAAVLLLSLYSAQQASAIKCYACNSDLNTDCIYNPAQAKFAVQCGSYVSTKNSSGLLEFNTHDNITTKAIIDYNCATAFGISTRDGGFRVERGCSIKQVTCDTYKYIYAVGDGKGNGFQVEKCIRCNTDFCNYSSK